MIYNCKMWRLRSCLLIIVRLLLRLRPSMRTEIRQLTTTEHAPDHLRTGVCALELATKLHLPSDDVALYSVIVAL